MKQLLILSGLLLLMTAVFAQNPQQVPVKKAATQTQKPTTTAMQHSATVHPATAPATTKAKPASEELKKK